MDPLTIALLLGGGSALASGGLQYFNSQQGLAAQDKQRAKIEQLVNNLQDPNFDFSNFDPESFQIIAQYNPQLAQFIAEKNPTLVQGQSADAKTSREAQMEVLRDMLQSSRNGNDAIYELQRNRSLRNALNSSNRFAQDVEMDMGRRGLTDSALGQALKAQANASQLQTAALEGEQAAANSQQTRMNQGQNAANLAGNIHGQELSQEEINARAINDFNNRMSANQQNYLNRNADTLNNAQQYNLGMAQDAANKNVVNNNNAKMWNIENQNKLKQQVFNNNAQKVGLQSGVAQNAISGIGDATKTQNQAYQSLGDAGIKMASYFAGQKEYKKPEDEYPYS